MNNESTNANTADNTNTAGNGADAGQQAGAENNKNTTTKSKLRRFGGYALKGGAVVAVVGVVYFGVRALLGSAGDEVVDALTDVAGDAVGAVA